MENVANTTNLNVRVDANLKQECDMLFKDLGLNMSTAINMFLTQCIKTSSIPFSIKEPELNKDLLKALEEAEYMKKHPSEYKSYDNINDLFEVLDSDD